MEAITNSQSGDSTERRTDAQPLTHMVVVGLFLFDGQWDFYCGVALVFLGESAQSLRVESAGVQ